MNRNRALQSNWNRRPNTGIRGALFVGLLLPLLFAHVPESDGALEPWRLWVALASVGMLCCCGLLLPRWAGLGKTVGIAGVSLAFTALVPGLGFDPASTLLGSVSAIWISWLILDFRPIDGHSQTIDRRHQLQERARWALRSLVFMVVLFFLMHLEKREELGSVLAVAVFTTLLLLAHWRLTFVTGLRRWIDGLGILALGLGLVVLHGWKEPSWLGAYALLLGLGGSFGMQIGAPSTEATPHWWDLFLDNPARLIVGTFAALCVVGTVLLRLPVAASVAPVSWLDACFTAVSAVCVTGLIVLDTPVDFSITGQAFILILIQLGGLGIMSVGSLAIHFLGKRFGLRRERVFAEAAQTDRSEMRASLLLILRYTLWFELIGALCLSGMFYQMGDAPMMAIWRGVFTAVSAFCNAGFALQSDSLIAYQTHAGVLNVVALLIIAGGMAPFTAVALPRLLRGKRVGVETRIIGWSSLLLLVLGTLGWLVFEWNGLLASLSLWDKFPNAWLQSATLRTAGFNSIDLASMRDPSYLFSMIWMFIGGSPGGTAGGVKTATIAVLLLTFWMRVRGRDHLVVSGRHIPNDTIFLAITILMAGLLVWVSFFLMLDVTQNLPARDLAFETTSALATVGLSLGATAGLDEIGKILIIGAMFIGRIGPLTLFMLLSEPSTSRTHATYPQERIHLS